MVLPEFMEAYIKITYLNDFLFCPLSIYYHELYGDTNPILYHDKPQIEGKEAHRTIEEKSYSTHKSVLQGIDVYSEKYCLCGKIDTFDVSTGVLTERKKSVKKVFDGYIFQLYGQCFALREMGHDVKKLRIWSKDDNRVYEIPLPEDDSEKFSLFESTIKAFNEFDYESFVQENQEKCMNCIYSSFCDRPNFGG